jgi:hypothetical protein
VHLQPDAANDACRVAAENPTVAQPTALDERVGGPGLRHLPLTEALTSSRGPWRAPTWSRRTADGERGARVSVRREADTPVAGPVVPLLRAQLDMRLHESMALAI